MSKQLEKQFKEEVARRQRKERKPILTKIVSLLIISGILSGLFYSIYRSISSMDPPVNNAANPQNNLTPMTLPISGLLKQYRPNPNDILGQIRIFLRPPLKEEKSSISSTCSYENTSSDIDKKNNYFLEFIDWKSNQIIATAFIRSGDMVEIRVPLGTYKMRYAVGTEWYGEKALFGSAEMFEMTDGFSSEPAKFDLTKKLSGIDLGFQCTNGNLGAKRVSKDSE